MNREIYIYGLCTNNSDDIMYVGKTVKKLKTRLREHINESIKLNSSKKHKWIIKSILNNYNTEIKLLEVCNKFNWPKREIFWINKYSKINENLTNATTGGERCHDFICKYSYKECSKFAIKNNIKSKNQWYKFAKTNLPFGIPKCPRNYYDEFESWGEFLNTGKIQDNRISDKYSNYDIARKWVHDNLNILTKQDWIDLDRNGVLPEFIPNNPYGFYKSRGWVSWGDFLGNGKIAHHLINYLTYEESKLFAQNNNIKSKTQWYEFIRNNEVPINIPKEPYRVYNRDKS